MNRSKKLVKILTSVFALVLISVSCILPTFADAEPYQPKDYYGELPYEFGALSHDQNGFYTFDPWEDDGKTYPILPYYERASKCLYTLVIRWSDFLSSSTYLSDPSQYNGSFTIDTYIWNSTLDSYESYQITIQIAMSSGGFNRGEINIYYDPDQPSLFHTIERGADACLIPFDVLDSTAYSYIAPLMYFSDSTAPVFLIWNNSQLAGANRETGSFYVQGYDSGYYDGYQEGNLNGYNQGYDAGYLAGVDTADLSTVGADLAFSIAEAPVNVLMGLLNFEILGINVFWTAAGILTILLVASIIRRFLL